MLAGHIAPHLDFDHAHVLPRDFINSKLDKHQVDILYAVPYFRNNHSEMIFLLIENQTRRERFMNLRLLEYMVQIWNRQLTEQRAQGIRAKDIALAVIVPVVFYTGKGKWHIPAIDELVKAPNELRGYLPNFDTIKIALDDLDTDRLLQSSVGIAIYALREGAQPLSELRTDLRRMISRLHELHPDGGPVFEAVYQMVILLLTNRRSSADEMILYNDIVEIESELNSLTGGTRMPTIQQKWIQDGFRRGREEGREEGRESGREEGSLETARLILIELGASKFGEPNKVHRAAIESVQRVSVLQTLIKAVGGAASWSDLLKLVKG